MDLPAILDLGFKVVLAVAQLALFIYVRNSNRSDKVDQRFTSVEESMQTQTEKFNADIGLLGQRIAHIEAKVEGAPTHDDLGELHEKINDVGEGVSGLRGEFRGVKELLDRIHEHLLRGGK